MVALRSSAGKARKFGAHLTGSADACVRRLRVGSETTFGDRVDYHLLTFLCVVVHSRHRANEYGTNTATRPLSRSAGDDDPPEPPPRVHARLCAGATDQTEF